MMDNQNTETLNPPNEQVKRISDTFNYFMQTIRVTNGKPEDIAWKLTQDAEVSYIHEKQLEYKEAGGRGIKRIHPAF